VAFRWRPGIRRRALAVDLGTARTVVADPDRGVVVDEPTVVAYGADGAVRAVGAEALRLALTQESRQVFPVRRGVVVDLAACRDYLTAVVAAAELERPTVVAVSVPAVASPGDRAALTEAVGQAVGGRVVPVESGLAASIGAGLDVSGERPELVCDVGAGALEVAAVQRGRVLAQAGASVGMSCFEVDERLLLTPLAAAVQEVLDGVPPIVAGDLAAQSMHLLGGGALLPGLATAIGDTCAMPVDVPPNPCTAIAEGLAACADGRGAAA
jgi:actin-like ATPase involved in cell morphogenesis